MAKVLIPEYLGQQVLSGARALSRSGDTCDLAWSFKGRRVFKTRHIRNYYNITPSRKDDSLYASDIIALCKEHNYDLILPFGNDSYYAVVKHADEISKHVAFMAPGQEAFSIAHDKSKTIDFCRQIGIDTPQIYTDFAENDLKAIANELRYPVVIKVRSGTGVDKGLRYANSKEELFEKYNQIMSFEADTQSRNYQSLIIQEFIPGFIHDACTLTNNGKVVTIMTQIRRIMYPIYGGVGAVNITTHNPNLSKIARKILEAVNWNGPAQIEFKYDPRDKKYKIIEINPKLWGTLDLSIKAGINFPVMIRKILTGQPVESDQTYPANVRYIFMFPQAVSAAIQLIKEYGFREMIRQFRRTSDHVRTYRDIDRTDILPDIRRAKECLRRVLFGKLVNVNSNLDKSLLDQQVKCDGSYD